MTGSAAIRSGSIAAGLQWTGAAQVTRVVLQFGVSIVLARLLEPSDFGLLAMASGVTAMASMFQSLGMHGPIVQRENVTDSLVNTIFVTNLVLSSVMTAALIVGAPWIAEIYRDEAVEPVIRVLALTLFMYALGGVPGALLRRRMQFHSIAKATVLAGVMQATVAVTLAVNGFGVWSLVSAMLVSATAEALFILAAARYWPSLQFSWTDLRSIAAFSMNITGVNVLDMVAKHADKLVIGRWLGAEALGFYGMGQRFTRQPVSMFVRPVLGPVLFPAYSRMQNDDQVTAATMRRAISGATLLMLPALLGFALVAEPFVLGLLGPKWAPAVPLIYVLAPVGMLHALLVTVISVLVARDRTGVFLMLRLLYAGSLIVAYSIGLQWGLMGVVLCILVAEAAVVSFELHFCARQVHMGVLSLLRGCVRIVGAALAMTAGVLLVRWAAAVFGWSRIVELGAAIAAGVIVYAVAVVLLRVPSAWDLAGLLPERAKQAVRRMLSPA